MERREPTLEAVSIDDVEHKNNGATSSVKQEVTRVESKSGIFSLIIAIAALGGSGYLAWQLQQSQAELAASNARIKVLEERLDFSKEESSQSVDAILAKLKWADSEIRKLWGVSNDRNKKKIAAADKKISSLTKSVTSLKKDLAKSSESAKKSASQLSGVPAKLTAVEKELASLKNTNNQQRLRDLTDQANRLQNSLDKLKRELTGRIRDNEENLESIDAYRLSIRRELQDIHRQLKPAGTP